MGDKPITQITGKDIKKLYDTLARQGNRTTGECLPAVLSVGFTPCSNEALGEAKQILTDEQLERFVEIIREDAVWYDFFYTELTTGLRRGEICRPPVEGL